MVMPEEYSDSVAAIVQHYSGMSMSQYYSDKTMAE